MVRISFLELVKHAKLKTWGGCFPANTSGPHGKQWIQFMDSQSLFDSQPEFSQSLSLPKYQAASLVCYIIGRGSVTIIKLLRRTQNHAVATQHSLAPHM